MASFTAEPTQGPIVEPWPDPASGSLPSRINPLPGALHRFLAVDGDLIGPFDLVEITATVGGVAGPLDTTLGGDLFEGFFIEKPPHFVNISHTIGQTSVQRFVPPVLGHYTFVMSRQSGDAVILHIDARKL